jgi:hypothetical protein
MSEADEGRRSAEPDEGGEQGRRSILLRLSEDEFRRLKHLADALGISVSETLRSLIPSIRLRDHQEVTIEADIAAAASFDLVPVAESYDPNSLRRLLEQIRNEGAALTLAEEIERQLLQTDAGALTVGTYRRLGRWCHPHRWTEREKRIRPLAEKLSELLYGRVIDRIG